MVASSGRSAPQAEKPTDHELMRRVAGGDRAALGQLVERHQRRVCSLAYRFLGHWSEAEDVTQDAFVRVLHAAARFRPEAQFTTWLYRLVVNLCWDRRRRAAREVRRQGAQRVPSFHDPPTAALEAEERIHSVRQAVAHLPDRQRLAVVLHRFEELSHQEIAEATGWSLAAVESCLVRAYDRLRRSLSDMSIGRVRPAAGTTDPERGVPPLGGVETSVQPLWDVSDGARTTNTNDPARGG